MTKRRRAPVLKRCEAVEHRIDALKFEGTQAAKFSASIRAVDLPGARTLHLELTTSSGGGCVLRMADRRELLGIIRVLEVLGERSVAEGFIQPEKK